MFCKDEPSLLSQLSLKLAMNTCINWVLLVPAFFSFFIPHPALCWLNEMTVNYPFCLLHISLAEACISGLRNHLFAHVFRWEYDLDRTFLMEICIKSVLCKHLNMKNTSLQISLALLSRNSLLGVSSHR